MPELARIPVRIVHELTGREFSGVLESLDIDQPLAVIRFGELIGCRAFSYNTGYGRGEEGTKERRISEWHIHPDDLEAVREQARAQGKKVTPRAKPKPRAPKPKKGPAPHPRQLFFGDNE